MIISSGEGVNLSLNPYGIKCTVNLSIYLSELTSVSLLWWQTSGTVCYDILVVIAGLENYVCNVYDVSIDANKLSYSWAKKKSHKKRI